MHQILASYNTKYCKSCNYVLSWRDYFVYPDESANQKQDFKKIT